MRILQGQAISPGYASGFAHLLDSREAVEIPEYQIDSEDVDAELKRFEHAIEATERELSQVEQRVRSELGGTYSSIFSAHMGLLRDRQFAQQVRSRVRNDHVNVEQAVDSQVSELMQMLSSLENEYLRERAFDIRDLGNRLMRQLAGGGKTRYMQLAPRSIIVAHELLPSETIDLDREHVVGIITEQGGDNSHAAILARAMGIPAVTGVPDASTTIKSGSRLLIDGTLGSVTIAPTEAAAFDLASLKSDYDDSGASAERAEGMECVTLDGVSVSLLANLNRLDELILVDAHRLDGVGLFRTEFLYIDSPVAPSDERQLELYERLLDGLPDRRLIVRTLDLGGDKIPRFMHPHFEANPSLGSRGLRFSLAHPELFDTQLRALLKASPRGDLRILFPMVLGESDFAEARQQVERISDQLNLNRPPRLGAMIETPAALFSLREILQQADFVSIGTNDLTQYMLAADRETVEMVDDYSLLHPSVLRAIRHVVVSCEQAGCDLSVCGEAAGEVGTARLLVGLGVRQLSMSPVRAARVRVGIRNVQASQLADLAEQALEAASAADVKALLSRFQAEKTDPALRT